MEGMQGNNPVTDDLPTVGIAIFGLGRIGTIHLDNLSRNPRAQIIYCVEGLRERISFVRNKWKLEGPFTTFLKPSEQDKVYQDERVDAVLVCTPTFAHEEIVLKSLEAGKAVFCEKPVAITYEGIKKCLASAKKVSKPLMCAFNRRFDPGARSLKTRIDSGEIGKVHVIKSCSRDSPKPGVDYLKMSGGIFHDCAVHDFDYICWVLGEYPESVTSVAHANYEDIKEIGDFDTVAITMKFRSGAIAIIDLSRHAAYGYDLRIEALGPKGMLTCGDPKPVTVQCHNEKGTHSVVPTFFSSVSRYRESYVVEMEHFLNVVQGKEDCEVKPESILTVSKIASACEQSARTGKPISIQSRKME